MDGHILHQAQKPTNFEDVAIQYFAKTPVQLIRRSLDQCSAIPSNTENNQRQGMYKVNLESSYASLGMEGRGHRTLDVLLSPRYKGSGLDNNIPPKQYSDGRLEVILMSVVLNRCYVPPKESKDGDCAHIPLPTRMVIPN